MTRAIGIAIYAGSAAIALTVYTLAAVAAASLIGA